jgi:hypothetical protein
LQPLRLRPPPLLPVLLPRQPEPPPLQVPLAQLPEAWHLRVEHLQVVETPVAQAQVQLLQKQVAAQTTFLVAKKANQKKRQKV